MVRLVDQPLTRSDQLFHGLPVLLCAGSRLASGPKSPRQLDMGMHDVLNVRAVEEGQMGDIRIQGCLSLGRRYGEHSLVLVEVGDEAEIADISLAFRASPCGNQRAPAGAPRQESEFWAGSVEVGVEQRQAREAVDLLEELTDL